MHVYDNGSLYSVAVSAAEVREFAARWPCSGMRYATRGIRFQFEKSNGDLVDISGERGTYDGSATLALSQDAQAFGARQLQCINCGAWPEGHCTTRTRPRHHLCDRCAGICEALAIGARQPVMLYDTLDPAHGQDFAAIRPEGRRIATSWTGVELGTIVHKTAPRGRRHRVRGATRYRVRMLDGSMWHGTGPTNNGTYIRLKPFKGE
jgi:hypothetical protein